MTDWSEISRQTIERAALAVPEGATVKERRAIIEAAYPFGPRAMWPYRAWCKARRKYMANFTGPPAVPLFPDLARDPVTGRPVIP